MGIDFMKFKLSRIKILQYKENIFAIKMKTVLALASMAAFSLAQSDLLAAYTAGESTDDAGTQMETTEQTAYSVAVADVGNQDATVDMTVFSQQVLDDSEQTIFVGFSVPDFSISGIATD